MTKILFVLQNTMHFKINLFKFLDVLHHINPQTFTCNKTIFKNLYNYTERGKQDKLIADNTIKFV